MTNDTRCCGSGACIIDPEGRCWCGQQWNPPATDQALTEAESNVSRDGVADATVESGKMMTS